MPWRRYVQRRASAQRALSGDKHTGVTPKEWSRGREQRDFHVTINCKEKHLHFFLKYL